MGLLLRDNKKNSQLILIILIAILSHNAQYGFYFTDYF